MLDELIKLLVIPATPFTNCGCTENPRLLKNAAPSLDLPVDAHSLETPVTFFNASSKLFTD